MSDWRRGLEKLEGAYSDATLRGYGSDMTRFALWCERHERPFLPLSADTIVHYIDDEAARLRPSTLKRRLCGISRIHRLLRHDDPTRDDDVYLAVRRAQRKRPSVRVRP